MLAARATFIEYLLNRLLFSLVYLRFFRPVEAATPASRTTLLKAQTRSAPVGSASRLLSLGETLCVPAFRHRRRCAITAGTAQAIDTAPFPRHLFPTVDTTCCLRPPWVR
jgi:hypothetical protein